MTFAFTPSTLFICLQCCVTYKFTAVGCLSKYMTYHVFIFFVFPKPSFVQLPPELAAGGVWCSAGRAGAGPVPPPRPGSRAALGVGTAGLAMGWGRQDVGQTGNCLSRAHGQAGQDCGRRRLTGLQVCWGWHGPWAVAGWGALLEARLAPVSRGGALRAWQALCVDGPVPPPITASLFSVSCPDSACPKASACTQPVFLCTLINTSSHMGWLLGTTACIKLCLYKAGPVQHCACAVRAEQKENKLGTVSGWFVKVPPQLKQAGARPAAPEQDPALPAVQLSGSTGLVLYLISSWPGRNRHLWALCCCSVFKRCYCVDIVAFSPPVIQRPRLEWSCN